MKKITRIAFLLIAYSTAVFAQTDPNTGAALKVLHVKGEISNKTRNKSLSLGDDIYRTDQVEVKESSSSCYFVNTKNTRYVLKGQNQGVFNLSENLMELPPRKMITQRGMSDTSHAMLSPADIFGNDHYIFLDTVETFKLDQKFFPISNTQQFVVRLFVGDSLYKTFKVKNQGQVVYVWTKDIKPVLSSLGEKRWLAKMELNLLDKETGYFKTICTFKPESFEFVPIKSELDLLVNNCKLNNLTAKQTFEEAVIYIEDIYGKCNQEVLKGLLLREYKIKVD
jgi:hypothetical protein